MTNETPPNLTDDHSDPDSKPLGLATWFGFTLLVLGLLAWLWTAEWRYALTGLALFVLGVLGEALDRRTKR